LVVFGNLRKMSKVHQRLERRFFPLIPDPPDLERNDEKI
jgi:hypothetical protein